MTKTSGFHVLCVVLVYGEKEKVFALYKYNMQDASCELRVVNQVEWQITLHTLIVVSLVYDVLYIICERELQLQKLQVKLPVSSFNSKCLYYIYIIY